jgi:hypothetical protein
MVSFADSQVPLFFAELLLLAFVCAFGPFSSTHPIRAPHIYVFVIFYEIVHVLPSNM